MNAFKKFALVCVSAILAACGGGGSDPEAPTTPVVATANTDVAKFTLTPSAKTLKADGKEVVTWTVYALTSGNGSVKGAKINLAATNGVILGASQVTTLESGAGATVTMIADPADQRNRTATLTATCTGCAAASTTSEISVTGATLSMVSSPDTNLVVGAATGATLKAILKDALGAVMPGVTLSFANTDPLVLSLSAVSAITDSTGSASVTVKGLSTGTARVNVSVLGAVASTEFVSSSPANALTVTSPTAGAPFTLGMPAIPVIVSAPGSTSVVFSATSGTFDKTTVAVANGSATSLFTPSQAGSITITVSDGKKTSSTDINVSPPISAVTKIFLNSSQSTLPLSSNGVVQSLKITATALTDLNQAVANVPISFTWSGGPGAGEKLTPALAYTDGSGKAYATFFAGTAASTAGNIKVNARFVNPTTGEIVTTGKSPSSNGESLTIGGSALSVSFGAASALTESTDKTLYTSSYSVQVTDANNNPVANQLVTLRMQPVAFSLGSSCTVTKTYCAEDNNGNGLLDVGEDGARLSIGIVEKQDVTVKNADGTSTTSTVDVETSKFDISKCSDPTLLPWTVTSLSKNARLTPQNSDGGSVPSIVTTDKNGIAAFDLTYLKGSALWVVNQLTATVSSNGTETSKSTVFRLAASEADVKLPDICRIPNSPYSN